MFLMANDILYYGMVEDPVFQASIDIKTILDAGENVTLYSSDYFVNPFACVDQHQFCNPVNNKCTKLDACTPAIVAAQKDLEYNPMQYGTVSTMSLVLYLSTISQSKVLMEQSLVLALTDHRHWRKGQLCAPSTRSSLWTFLRALTKRPMGQRGRRPDLSPVATNSHP